MNNLFLLSVFVLILGILLGVIKMKWRFDTIVSSLEGGDRIWSKERANNYYDRLLKEMGPMIGCNYIPSDAGNQLEFWQEDSFNPELIDIELELAQSIGMNVIRVYIHNIAYHKDPNGLKNRMKKFLDISEKHDIKVMFVFFDDCWNREGRSGKQKEPIPGVHNSIWLQSPGDHYYKDDLEKYVKDILTEFKDDKRIILWDLYNEPGNAGNGYNSALLLENVFKWFRDVNPSQPCSSPLYDPFMTLLNHIQLSNSDIITFHNYYPLWAVKLSVWLLHKFMPHRPLIITEFMARPMNNKLETVLPFFVENRIGAFIWGFIDGRSQTKFGWECSPGVDDNGILKVILWLFRSGKNSTWDNPCHLDYDPWFHDIFTSDLKPYDEREIELIKKLSKKK